MRRDEQAAVSAAALGVYSGSLIGSDDDPSKVANRS